MNNPRDGSDRGYSAENFESPGRSDLESYATLWGLLRRAKLNEDDRLTDREIFLIYMTCSVPYVDWTLVYKALPEMTLTTDQLHESARKAAALPSDPWSGIRSWRTRTRVPVILADLFRGSCFGHSAMETSLYEDLQDLTCSIPCWTMAYDVMAFHLVGTPYLVSVIEDPQSPFVLGRVPCSEREKFKSGLESLAKKWASTDPVLVATETALMIRDCQYPFLDSLSGNYVVMSGLKQQQELHVSMMRVRSSAAASAKGSRPVMGLITGPPTLCWSVSIERTLADDPRFRRYKQHKGWPAFHPSRDTVEAYLADMCNGDLVVAEDCKNMSSKDVLELVRRLAPYLQVTIILDGEQGKTFVRAMSTTATPQQLSGWSTLDVAQRLLVAHHPQWQTHYSHAWNLDRTTITEITAYREKWPRLPGNLFGVEAEDQDNQ